MESSSLKGDVEGVLINSMPSVMSLSEIGQWRKVRKVINSFISLSLCVSLSLFYLYLYFHSLSPVGESTHFHRDAPRIVGLAVGPLGRPPVNVGQIRPPFWLWQGDPVVAERP